MSRSIAEADWKLLRQLHPIALDRFCRRVLSELDRIISDGGMSSHDRYSAVVELIGRRDRELAQVFDDQRRSTALIQLMLLKSHGLLTEEEVSRFSPETREVLRLGG